MTDARFSLLDLLDLSDLDKEIVIWLVRHGPAGPDELAQALGYAGSEVQDALATLAAQHRVRPLPHGQFGAVMGRARGRATLPARLWNAVLTTERPYSRQDIATLRTAVPILQFARARLAEFADHGPGHALRVRSFAGQLGFIVGLSPAEQQLLRTGALFHDVGNVVDRARHNEISRQTVLRLCTEGQLPFDAREAKVVGLLCQWHRGVYDPHRRDDLGSEIVRTGLLASILRVADAMDIDHRRSDYTQRLAWVLRLFYPQELPYWTSLEEILGVRIRCAPEVQLQVLTAGHVSANMQITMLRGDLESTPFDWSLRELAVEAAPPPGKRTGGKPRRPALLVFPFEPHSLIMAALSRKHLVAAGHEVELLCYPDTAGGPRWLWGGVLAETDPGRYDRLVVIGDRPDPATTSQLFRTVASWQRAGAAVSLLNRHEANWARLPALLQSGVKVILGGDWAYFWGDAVSRADLTWARVAALCSRDPTQATPTLTGEELAASQGMLAAVYDAARQPANDTLGWAALAGAILDRIEADDRAFFTARADDLVTYSQPAVPYRVVGRVLLFEGAPAKLPQACSWVMQETIERQGRAPERGFAFDIPYAIAVWPATDAGGLVDLLAINHWREEVAIPIRLLYPDDGGAQPAGNECTIQVRLSDREAQRVVRALVAACNQTED